MQHHVLNGYYTADSCVLSDFISLLDQRADITQFTQAHSVQKNILIYNVPALQALLADVSKRQALMAEWAHVLHSGPGVLVLKGIYEDTAILDEATKIYETIITDEKAKNRQSGDHFAAAGSNDRIWNSLQKLCLAAPEVFASYFAVPAVDTICEAWLGPNYQMTAQVNLVHPGGKAQQAHRDYHLGFQTAKVSATYPAHVHDLSPLMTLQGGIAHCDMPIEHGPTKLLPFSQLYRPGYAAWRHDDFRAYFEENYVQLPLSKGDALFFSPALFHAAGENSSRDAHRFVNLLQVSSPFGRAMESVNRTAMCEAILEPLQKAWRTEELSDIALNAVLNATAEGYSFPTNLDSDPPINGLAPKTQKQILKEAVLSGTNTADFKKELCALAERQKA